MFVVGSRSQVTRRRSQAVKENFSRLAVDRICTQLQPTLCSHHYFHECHTWRLRFESGPFCANHSATESLILLVLVIKSKIMSSSVNWGAEAARRAGPSATADACVRQASWSIAFRSRVSARISTRWQISSQDLCSSIRTARNLHWLADAVIFLIYL